MPRQVFRSGADWRVKGGQGERISLQSCRIGEFPSPRAAAMKGKKIRLVTTTKTTRRRWSHADPDEMRKLLEDALTPRQATALRRHLRSCLDCALLAGRLAAIQGVDLERTS